MKYFQKSIIAGISLFLITPLVHAQQFAYERDIEVPGIEQETSVWIPLDLHAAQESPDSFRIRNQNDNAIPYKYIHEQSNLLNSASIAEMPQVADTVPITRGQNMFDNNGLTFFQPETKSEHIFQFSFDTPVAPEYLTFQLHSGWIEYVTVRSGLSARNLQKSFIGYTNGSHMKLSGERAKIFEITIRVRSGVLQISEMKLLSPQTKLLFRAKPNETYRLLYGTQDTIEPLDNSAVFSDTNTVFAKLSTVRFTDQEAQDSDSDGITDSLDNCPNQENTDQVDRDGDGIGDACDNAPTFPNTRQNDGDEDGIGDAEDNCPNYANPDQKDVDLDGRGWVCDDADYDGIRNAEDNCVGFPNRDQQDLDNNNIGDACEDDRDQDGIPKDIDNCSTTPNPDQSNEDGDRIGDACDNCPYHYNSDQIDRDGDGRGDVCQKIEEEKALDQDEDGITDDKDNCDQVPNPDQADQDEDGVGNMCDNCPSLKNTLQEDRDYNGVGDVCTDTDRDGVLDPYDNCAPYSNPEQTDKDEDGIGDPCDDDDRDGVQNARDNCPYDSNRYQSDQDRDGIGNVCDDHDDRWTEERPWLLWLSMASIILVLAVLGGIILRKTK